MADLFELAAQARPLIQQLHQRGDVVLQLKSDASSHAEDLLSAEERAEVDHPGKFTLENKFLTVNLDGIVSPKRPVEKLDSVEDFRKHPVLAGVAAHASAHARFSIWDQDSATVPTSLPNPDFDPMHPTATKPFEITEDDGETITMEEHDDPDYAGPESFPVSNSGRLMQVAGLLEEARVERLAMKTFGRTWREALKYSSTHLTLESMDEGDEANDGEGESALDAALRTTILIGGRTVAGTLGFDTRNRAATQKVLGNSQKVIEAALAEKMAENPAFDPFHDVMGLVSDAVFDNTHDDAIPHLEYARKILNIIHPEDKENPDSPGASEAGSSAGAGGMGLAAGSAPGEKPESGEDEDGDDPVSGNQPNKSEARKAMEEAAEALMGDLKEALNELVAEAESNANEEETRVDEELADDADGSNRNGAVRSKNEKPPHIDHYETPNADDRALAKKAEEWMRAQIEPTVTEFDRSQWMPGGGTRFNARNWVRDELGDRMANERTDWDKSDTRVKVAPPVIVGMMLDGSGSMRSRARSSASIAYAVAVASASLPESRTASLVFGHDALLTQEAGHGVIPTEVAVARNNAGWENFTAGAAMIERELQLEPENFEDGAPTNVLIIIVSDLSYGAGPGQGVPAQRAAFGRKVAEWHERGFRTLVVGAHPYEAAKYGDSIELAEVGDLFQ